MRSNLGKLCLLGTALFCAVSAAQDLVVGNARIIDGTGRVIEDGAIRISDGRIQSVTTGPSGETAEGVHFVDAGGMTVMPGLIDTHRHIIGGDEPIDSEAALDAWLADQAPERMREFLDAGFTTVLSAGDATEGIVELRRRIREAEIPGPRLLVSGSRIMPATPEEVQRCRSDAFCSANTSLFSDEQQARAAVDALADAGVDAVKIRLDADDPTGLDEQTAAIVAEQAARRGLPAIVHATSVDTMLASMRAGLDRLVHTPHTQAVVDSDAARVVSEAGIPMSSTLGVWVPIFGESNQPLWRNGSPLPAAGIARVGQGQANARYLWNAGVLYAFGTDTRFHPTSSLLHELRALSVMFSARDIVAMITRNAAAWLELENEIGTLEPGKRADVVVIDGDPLRDIRALADVRVVIKDGRLVRARLR